MLFHSLIVFSGVSKKREFDFWSRGVTDWEKYELEVFPQKSLLEQVEQSHLPLSECRAALARGDAQFFAERLDRADHFRIALAFPKDCLFLDIETTGLSRYYDQITVIGWNLGGEYGFLVKGQQDISIFKEVLSRAKCVVTFNGSLFDIPFIKEEYPEIVFPKVHVDLRFLSRRVDLSGGQKSIETQIGIKRSVKVGEISGEFAPVLWHEYVLGDTCALERLLRYNAADISGMIEIFCHVTREVMIKSGLPMAKAIAKATRASLKPKSLDAEQAIAKSVRPYPSTGERLLRIEDIVFIDRPPRLKVVGIDLTGSEARPSGWCLLDGHEATTAQVHTDEELIARTLRERPNVVSIDSPLSLPEGRITVEDTDPGRNEFGIMRYCERVLKRRGVNVYPALLPSMQRLTARGISLAGAMRKLGMPVIESYPGAAQDIMRIPRKRKGLEYLEQGLASFGISGPFVKGAVSHDELDAITSAVVGVFFWAGLVERLGPDPLGEEALFIPDLRVDAADARKRLIVGISGSLGAGKTTGARHLEKKGFHYCRYSEVVERVVSLKLPSYTRSHLQEEGQRIHTELGQRWLGKELVRPLLDRQCIVIDGMRFPEDHAFLTEIFASQFIHIHVVAPRSLRKERFEGREGVTSNFEIQDSHAVESNMSLMESLAREIVANRESVSTYHAALDAVIHKDWRN